MNADPIVFVVDDDASFRQSTGRLIQSMGFEVKTFGTPRSIYARDGPMWRLVWCSTCACRD